MVLKSKIRFDFRRSICRLFLLALVIFGPGVANAGPPFLTDDPEPVDFQHWEIYTFSQLTHTHGNTSGSLAAAEANYGAIRNVHLHVLASLAYDNAAGESAHSGFGDAEIGAKYKFLSEDDFGVSAATFPACDFPTGDTDRALGDGHTRFFLPLWLQKTFGEWTTYGGGGYWRNPGDVQKDFWFFGWELQRQITDDFVLGAEVFHQTADEVGGPDSTGFNVGGVLDLTENHHFLLSVGRGVRNADETNRFSFYVGYQLTF